MRSQKGENIFTSSLFFHIMINSVLFAGIINTPEGREVTTVSGWSGEIYWTTIRTQDIIVEKSLDAEIIENPATSHNCHGYAWCRTEGIGTYWIDYQEEKFYNDDSYSNDGYPSYITCTSSEATHGCYEPYSDHSIRVIKNAHPVSVNGTKIHVSKWREGPVVRHGVREDFYSWFYAYNNGAPVPIAYTKLKTTHGGTLSNYPKKWIGAGGTTHTLTDNVIVPSGVTLQINSGATVLLSYYMKCVGSGVIINNGTVTPNTYMIKEGTNNELPRRKQRGIKRQSETIYAPRGGELYPQRLKVIIRVFPQHLQMPFLVKQ